MKQKKVVSVVEEEIESFGPKVFARFLEQSAYLKNLDLSLE